MPTLDDVYRKLGAVAEAAQLLETDIGTRLLMLKCIEHNLFAEPISLRRTGSMRRSTSRPWGECSGSSRASFPSSNIEELEGSEVSTLNGVLQMSQPSQSSHSCC